MTTDEHRAEYREMIANLSDKLPAHQLEPKDIHLKPAELSKLFAYYDAAQTVCEGIEDSRGFDLIAELITQTDNTSPVALYVGVAVLNAIHQYAAKLACNDVLAIRDEPYDVPLHTRPFGNYARA
jgi:hypothetical protein